MNDEQIIMLINDYAKTDPNAFLLMVKLQAAKEFGEKDMLINQMARYLKDNGKS